ncbi:MAG: PAS domain-containing protein [Sulfurovum sp.]|nr:PAS domain-containing protein [Sulfurovum sp.]
MSEFLGNGMPADLPEGHPVRVYLDENRLVRELIGKIKNINIQEESENFTKLFKSLRLVEKHFARKENQLFPYLEKYGWTSPSQNMWAFHDQIRDEIKAVRKAIESGDIVLVSQNLAQIFRSLEHLMVVEENRLLPNALNMLSEEDWKEMREGDEEIGWMLDVPPVAYPEPSEEAYIHPSKDTKKRNLPFSLEDRIKLDEGYMLPEQINLLLKFMPVDITYVDENDTVIFYNRGEDRVFPRSAGIIGREVKFCHPPKSVDQVLMILREFKAGRKDEAEFWIEFKGKFIHIRYFAIRDEEGAYKGVIEVSQDVTHIRSLSGERRLLDWK